MSKTCSNCIFKLSMIYFIREAKRNTPEEPSVPVNTNDSPVATTISSTTTSPTTVTLSTPSTATEANTADSTLSEQQPQHPPSQLTPSSFQQQQLQNSTSPIRERNRERT